MHFIFTQSRIRQLAFVELNHTMLEVKGVMHCMAVLDLLASPSDQHFVVHVSLNG